jgi:vancomycin resistance protein YoaR
MGENFAFQGYKNNMFYWSDQSIEWFSSSAKQTDFHKILANEIIPYLSNDSTLLSLGSGLGFLEREISPYLKSMTLVDNSQKVIEYLNKNKKSNQVIINGDSNKIDVKADYLLLSFFSRMFIADTIEHYLKLTKDKIFYIVNQRRSDIETVIQYLDSKNLVYSYKKMKLQFNQELKTSEIDAYLTHYYSSCSEEKRQNLLNQFEKIDSENVIFKNRKKIVLFIISKQGDIGL